MVLVVGATGRLGMEICRRLRESGQPARAMLRMNEDSDRVEQSRQLGVELFTGDLTDSVAVAEACEEITSVISCASCALTQEPCDAAVAMNGAGLRSLVQFAHVFGVQRFVFLTVPFTFHTKCDLFRLNNEVADRLEECGTPYTVLSMNFLMETWLSPQFGFDYENGEVVIYGRGDQPVAFVSCADVAELAVRSLQTPALRNKEVTVGGPANVTPLEAVAIFEEVSGRRFTVVKTPVEDLEREYQTARDPLSRSLAALKIEYAHGCPLDKSDIRKVLPAPMTSVRDYASYVAAPKVSVA